MRLLIQRVKGAAVYVEGKNISEIHNGLLVLVGIGKDDTPKDLEKLALKLTNLRIFEDDKGKMNLNVTQVNGEVLSVPQFTLYADTTRGNRPGFDLSAEPDRAKEYWERFNSLLAASGINVKRGVFGAHMEVTLTNDGPVTIWLDSGM